MVEVLAEQQPADQTPATRDPDPAEQERADRLLFAGMTRVTVRLELMMKAGNPLKKEEIEETCECSIAQSM
jgi:hypothetical protein